MEHYTQSTITRQALGPAEFNIYNQFKQKEVKLTRKYLAKATNYAITTIRDALQKLSKKGLIYFNRVLRCWVLRVIKQKTEDIYDSYIKLKREWKGFVSRVGGRVMAKMKWGKVKSGIDRTPEPKFIDEYANIKVPGLATPKKNLKREMEKDKRKEAAIRRSTAYKS